MTSHTNLKKEIIKKCSSFKTLEMYNKWGTEKIQAKAKLTDGEEVAHTKLKQGNSEGNMYGRTLFLGLACGWSDCGPPKRCG